jgi:hypothetical protein
VVERSQPGLDPSDTSGPDEGDGEEGEPKDQCQRALASSATINPIRGRSTPRYPAA